MDDLSRMAIFFHVVEAKSFTAAARRLGIARSAVSRHVALLEKQTGVRLLNRTTRSVSMTDAGKAYFQSCSRIVAEAQKATHLIQQLRDEPVGVLRVAGPISLGSLRIIEPMVNDFILQYSSLKVDLLLDDKEIDIVKEGVDVYIYEGWLRDSNFIARKMFDAPRLLCVAPAYADRCGLPQTPEELKNHQWVINTMEATPNHCTLTLAKDTQQKRSTKDIQQIKIPIKGRIKTNNVIATRSLLLAGAGIATLADYQIEDDIAGGRLIHLFPEYGCGHAGVYAIYQHRQYQQTKVKLFIEFMETQLNRLMQHRE